MLRRRYIRPFTSDTIRAWLLTPPYLQVPDTDLPLSEVFSRIEGQKSSLSIQEYSVSQTSLEQIFNQVILSSVGQCCCSWSPLLLLVSSLCPIAASLLSDVALSFVSLLPSSRRSGAGLLVSSPANL
jgi:hypothetical protein